MLWLVFVEGRDDEVITNKIRQKSEKGLKGVTKKHRRENDDKGSKK